MRYFVKFLDEVGLSDKSLVGGKAASLGEMLQAGINVPPGFVITTDAFNGGMTPELQKNILECFDELGTTRVAVRSSAVAEDSDDASWAGQLESYLNTTRNGLIEAVEKCWESIKSERAIEYADEHGVNEDQRAVAVVVQAMVDSEISGVLFTANPVTQNRMECLIEAIHGLGELLVQGAVTPESFITDRSSEIKSHSSSKQRKKLIYKDGANQEVEVTPNNRILNKQLLKKLVATALKIEKHYEGVPQDIEWAVKNDHLYIVQSRPITTLGNTIKPDLPEFFSHCIKTIARPATLQRDELFRYTSNAILPIDVVTIPLEGANRAYYLEAENTKKLLGICLSNTNTQEKHRRHLKDYEMVKVKAQEFKELVQKKPNNFKAIFKQYFRFLDGLSSFLYVGVAIDKILYPKFKTTVEELYPESAEKILEIASTPKDLHDYQKQRLAICELAIHYKQDQDAARAKITNVVQEFRHVNEYSFVEHLSTPEDINRELTKLTLEEAFAEANDIRGAIEKDKDYRDSLIKLLPDEELLAQALLIKEYAWLRTDRIDRLKSVQVALRDVFEQLAKDFSSLDGNAWTNHHLANLLNDEINEYIRNGQIPDFQQAEKRINQQYLYYYTNNKTTVITDSEIVAEAQTIIIKPEEARTGSLISLGTTAYRGVTTGRVVKISDQADLKRVQPGDIMVARVTMPDYTAVMKQAAGFITAEGGITSHAAIVARELGKPCIVGSDNCMDTLNDGDLINLDATNQTVQYQQLSTVTFEKTFTREESLIWGELLLKEVDQWLAIINSAYIPSMFFRINQGLLETWLCDEATQVLIDYVYDQNIKDSNYLLRNVKRYKELVGKLHAFEKQKYARNLKELKQYLELFRQAIIPLHTVFFTPFRDDTPKPLFDLAVKTRGEDALFDNGDLYLRDSLVRLYPECNGAETFIGLKELEHPDLAKLRSRENDFILFEGRYLPVSILEFRGAHPDYIFRVHEVESGQKTITGSVAYRGSVKGTAQIIMRKKEVVDFKEGNILVAPMTTPHYLPAMRKATAFITDEGGITSHAAIVAREMKTPCIIGTKVATQVLHDGDVIELDATSEGVVTVLEPAHRNEAQTNLPKWDDVELFRWGPIPGKLFYISDYVEAASRLSNYLGTAFPETVLLFKSGQMVWLCNQEEITRTGKEIFKQYVLSDNELKAWHKQFDKNSKELQTYQHELSEKEIGEMSGDELKNAMKMFFDMVVDFWLPTIPAEIANYGSSDVLRSKLAEFIDSEEGLGHAIQVLTAPEELSYNQREEIELSHAKDIGAHQGKYFWLQNNYAGSKNYQKSFSATAKKN